MDITAITLTFVGLSSWGVFIGTLVYQREEFTSFVMLFSTLVGG